MRLIVLALLITALLLLVYIMLTLPDEIGIRLVINGETVEPDVPVIVEIIDDEELFFVPAVFVSEKLGFETKWDMSSEVLLVFLGDFTVQLTVDSRIVMLGDTITTWSAPVKKFGNLIYIPAYDAAETLGALVKWDETERKLSIHTPAEFDPFIEEELEGPLLMVTHPPETGLFNYYGESLFVFGTTKSYRQVNVTVNGEPVELYDPRSGNFLTMVEIPRGEVVPITVEATSEEGITTIERTVIYPDWWDKMPKGPLSFHPTRLVPAEKQLLKTGDILQIAFQGSPGGEALFQIGDGNAIYKMVERAYPGGPAGGGGIYTATYKVKPRDVPETGLTAPLPVIVTLRKGEEQVSRQMPGKIVFLAEFPYKLLEVKAECELKNRGWLYLINQKQLQLLSGTLGGSGYPAATVSYLVEGTRYRAVGAFGDYYRVLISGNDNYLIHREAVRVLESKDLPEPLLSKLTLVETEDKVSLLLYTSEQFPFFVEDGKNSLAVKMYGLTVDQDLSVPLLSESVKDLSFLSRGGNGSRPSVLNVEINFEMTGFRTRWDDSGLLIDLYKPGQVDIDNPLKGKVIIVDPGHGGSEKGASGPGDLDEKDVVLAMSLYLRDILTEEGAIVIMTRTEDIDVNLFNRPERIDEYNADFFISIHANAHADNAPATKIHGLMILYNYAHNEKLADIMLETMVEHSELPKFRTWRRNIAVLRHPQLPSVLVEAGYMMHPHDNWYILHPRGQQELARAMMKGIKNYFIAAGYQE